MLEYSMNKITLPFFLSKADQSELGFAVLEQLQSGDLDIDTTSLENGGISWLHAAASSSINTGLVKALIEKGLDVNAFASKEITPLHFACSEGHLDHIKELMKAGANVSWPDLTKNNVEDLSVFEMVISYRRCSGRSQAEIWGTLWPEGSLKELFDHLMLSSSFQSRWRRYDYLNESRCKEFLQTLVEMDANRQAQNLQKLIPQTCSIVSPPRL